jgi:predicted transglutaminase-like cysteine proteinase
MKVSASFRIMLTAAVVAAAGSTASAAGGASMRVAGVTAPPIGHVRFCEANRDDCGTYERTDQVVRLNAAAWRALTDVNKAVNDAVIPATDMEIYGTVEHWDYPALVGDCEDYVLEKRRMLVRVGWPASALLITVVRDEIGEGHAVLTVRTDRGDLVLDNKTDDVLLWDETPYQFVKRQSTRDPQAWVGIADDRVTAAVGSLR